MNNLDKILDSIRADADEKIAAVNDAASAERAQAESDARDRIANMKDKNDEKCRREREMILSRSRGSAEMRRREIMLGARVGLLDKAYSDAEKYICSMDEKVYDAFLARLLCDALCDRSAEERALAECGEEISEGEFTVAFNKADLARCAERIVADAVEMTVEKGERVPTVTVCPTPVAIGGGFILRLGDVETDCSVKTLIAASRVNTEADCAKVLFQ